MPTFTEAFLQGFNPGRTPSAPKTRFGYTVEDSMTAGWDDWFKKNPYVSGMAVGGPNKLNGDERPDRTIVVNPYAEPMMEESKREALIRLEAARHLMDEEGYKPAFQITPQLQAWRQKAFIKGRDPYATDDKAFRETVISRALVGDLDPTLLTPEIAQEAKMWNWKLDKRDKGGSTLGLLRR